MAADTQERHRPGALKQQNKRHNTGRHRSKGELEKAAKGRIGGVKSLSKRLKKDLSRNARRNQAVQHRKSKREEILEKKRSRGSSGSPPFLVTVLALSEDVDTKSILEIVKSCDEEATVTTSPSGVIHIGVPRFKQRLSFVVPEYGNLYHLLDAAKVSDVVLLLPSAETGVDEYGDHCLSSLFAQGLPATAVAVEGLKSLNPKQQSETRKMIQKHLESRFPGTKIHGCDSVQDGMLLLRTICTQKMKYISLRDYRPHLAAEAVSMDITDEQARLGTLKVRGYLRGQSLSVNGLVHLPGWGDFQMLEIDAPHDPNVLGAKGRQRKNDVDMESLEDNMESPRMLERSDPGQQAPLEAEVTPDPMEGEQTWPTEEELAEANAEAKERKLKRVPKGTSAYQAAWIVDSDNEQEEDAESSGDEDMEDDVVPQFQPPAAPASMEGDDSSGEEESDAGSDEEYETISVIDDAEKYDAAMNMDEEEAMLNKYKQAREDQMFPDEIDTPVDIPARVRFQKFRGLKSFRTSAWDPKENLPLDYARIFQFHNFKRSRRRILDQDREGGAMPGWYITVHIANVPMAFMESYEPGTPLAIYGLLPHEQRMSVIHFLLKRTPSNSQPIKSKERMIFHVGYRRFAANPIYSQHTNADKHKFERFFRHEGVTVATVYAPILFPPASVMMFQEGMNGQHELMATGSVLSVNPDRIITKRAVLSGHTFKINKRSAVVRYLFFNREDILWFKPVELRTKYGRRGHIREPLGTHGHMKCVFDGQLTSMDTIMMNLYKRVYPRWNYDPRIMPPPPTTQLPTSQPAPEEMDQELFE